MDINTLTGKIIGAAIEVHRELGPGLLERIYEVCLVEELRSLGLKVESQKDLPIIYKDKFMEEVLRIDLLVEDRVIVELKTAESLLPVHRAQILSYMKLAQKEVGLLINFHVALLKNGIERFRL
ncbi:MAG: GxxExxY protein [Prevotella sp.]|nr:GxxExxY protein [Prevotella sp.]